jgi:hypothetical protein
VVGGELTKNRQTDTGSSPHLEVDGGGLSDLHVHLGGPARVHLDQLQQHQRVLRLAVQPRQVRLRLRALPRPRATGEWFGDFFYRGVCAPEAARLIKCSNDSPRTEADLTFPDDWPSFRPLMRVSEPSVYQSMAACRGVSVLRTRMASSTLAMGHKMRHSQSTIQRYTPQVRHGLLLQTFSNCVASTCMVPILHPKGPDLPLTCQGRAS